MFFVNYKVSIRLIFLGNIKIHWVNFKWKFANATASCLPINWILTPIFSFYIDTYLEIFKFVLFIKPFNA